MSEPGHQRVKSVTRSRWFPRRLPFSRPERDISLGTATGATRFSLKSALKETIMLFTLTIPIIACAIAAPVFMATPGWAQDPGAFSRYHRTHHYYRDYSGYLNPRSGHYDPEFQRNRENFGFSGRDPSRIGGEDPSLHPAPY